MFSLADESVELLISKHDFTTLDPFQIIPTTTGDTTKITMAKNCQTGWMANNGSLERVNFICSLPCHMTFKSFSIFLSVCVCVIVVHLHPRFLRYS